MAWVPRSYNQNKSKFPWPRPPLSSDSGPTVTAIRHCNTSFDWLERT